MRSPDTQSTSTPTPSFRVAQLSLRDSREPVVRAAQLEAVRALLAADRKAARR